MLEGLTKEGGDLLEKGKLFEINGGFFEKGSGFPQHICIRLCSQGMGIKEKHKQRTFEKIV